MNDTPLTDANTLATGQLSLEQSTLASEYGAYFTALTTACGDLVDATVGGYYTSLVSAVQTAFNSQRSSENTLITTAISKENSFNTSVLGLSTTYATAEINADYAYYNALINSHASELQTALTNEQSLIAAEIACYRAFSDAVFTRDSSVVTANADAARAEVVAELGARSTFNTTIMNALDTANGSYRAAVGASDLNAALESYQNAYYETDATLNSSVASAFGTFQIGVRQDRLAGVTSSNPRYSAYASDVTWATQTKSLRDQSVTQYNADQSAYVASVAAAQKSYNVNALSSLLDAAGQTFTVNKTHALQTASIGSTLELADYDAVKAFTEIRMVTLSEDVTVIRYYSKEKPSQMKGPWWTFEKGTRESLAILHEWNKMDGIVVSTIPKNTTIFIGPAASQREVIDKIERELKGGQIQIYWFNPTVD